MTIGPGDMEFLNNPGMQQIARIEDEPDIVLKMLHEAYALMAHLERVAFPLDPDWPADEFDQVKERIGKFLWPNL